MTDGEAESDEILPVEGDHQDAGAPITDGAGEPADPADSDPDASTPDRTGSDVTPGDDDTTDDAPDAVDRLTPTPQSEALRRQQFLVGTGGGILVGIAVTVSIAQRFPDVHLGIPVLIGLLGTAIILWVTIKSVFPGSSERLDV